MRKLLCLALFLILGVPVLLFWYWSLAAVLVHWLDARLDRWWLEW